jgi:hypothetical protein
MQDPLSLTAEREAEKIEASGLTLAQTASSFIANHVLHAPARSAARCFHGIGGLALLHTMLLILGVNLGAAIGLGVTATLAARSGHDTIVLVLISNGWMAGLFFLCGLFAEQQERWAFVLGMALYGLDAMLLLYARMLPAVAVHALLLYALYYGLKKLPQAANVALQSKAAAAGAKKAA